MRRSHHVERKLLQVVERRIFERAFVGGGENHPRGFADFESFMPAWCTETPAIARLQSGESELFDGRREIVSRARTEREEVGGRHDADRVRTEVGRSGVAAAVAKEAGE